MKRITKIAGMASIAAAAAVMWSVPAAALAMCGSSACAEVHDRWPGRPTTNQIRSTTHDADGTMTRPAYRSRDFCRCWPLAWVASGSSPSAAGAPRSKPSLCGLRQSAPAGADCFLARQLP